MARSAIWAALLAATLVAVQPARADFEAGQRASDAGHLDEALTQWRAAADAGTRRGVAPGRKRGDRFRRCRRRTGGGGGGNRFPFALASGGDLHSALAPAIGTTPTARDSRGPGAACGPRVRGGNGRRQVGTALQSGVPGVRPRCRAAGGGDADTGCIADHATHRGPAGRDFFRGAARAESGPLAGRFGRRSASSGEGGRH